MLAGNVALSLLHGSPCAVAVAPKGYAEQASHAVKEVTVGYDGSPESRAAVNDALEFARSANASVKVVVVAEPPPVSYGKGANQGRPELAKDIEKIMRSRLDELLAELPDDVPSTGCSPRATRRGRSPRWRSRTAASCSPARAATARCGACCSAPFPASWCAPLPAP